MGRMNDAATTCMEPPAGGPAAPPLTAPAPRRAALGVAALVVYGLCLHVPFLGAWPLGSHEALAAQRACEMTTVGGWLVPHLQGEPDFRKPPLPFWFSGGLAALAGAMDEWTARLPSVAASLGTMLVLVFWMRRLTGWRPALTTGFAFVTSGGALVWSRRAEVDMQLCFWTTASMAAFWLAMEEPSRRRQIFLALAMWVSLAAAVLTKGPLPVAMVAVSVAAAAILDPQRRRAAGLLPLAGPLVFLAALAPWAVAVVVRYPEAASQWYEQSLGRYAGDLGHEKPVYFYALETPLLWLPWLLPLTVGVWLALRRRALTAWTAALLLAWGVGGLAILSLGSGKRLHYALPALPPMMMFAGLGLERLLRPPRPLAGVWRWGAGLHASVVPAALAAGLVAAWWMPERGPSLAALGVLAAAGLGLVLLLYLRGRAMVALGVLAVSMLAALTFANGAVLGPLLTQEATEAAIGRCVARAATRPGGMAFYRHAEPRVVFYAGRSAPVLTELAQVAAWRARVPGGYLVVPQVERAQVETIGTWREVLPGAGADRFVSRDTILLRAVGSPETEPGRPARTAS